MGFTFERIDINTRGRSPFQPRPIEEVNEPPRKIIQDMDFIKPKPINIGRSLGNRLASHTDDFGVHGDRDL